MGWKTTEGSLDVDVYGDIVYHYNMNHVSGVAEGKKDNHFSLSNNIQRWQYLVNLKTTLGKRACVQLYTLNRAILSHWCIRP